MTLNFGPKSFKRADLYRFNDDRITKTIIPLDLDKVLKNDDDHNIILLPDDEIQIFSKRIFRSESKVFIEGAIKNPEDILSEKI